MSGRLSGGCVIAGITEVSAALARSVALRFWCCFSAPDHHGGQAAVHLLPLAGPRPGLVHAITCVDREHDTDKDCEKYQP
jgi:hypothetical protein